MIDNWLIIMNVTFHHIALFFIHHHSFIHSRNHAACSIKSTVFVVLCIGEQESMQQIVKCNANRFEHELKLTHCLVIQYNTIQYSGHAHDICNHEYLCNVYSWKFYASHCYWPSLAWNVCNHLLWFVTIYLFVADREREVKREMFAQD